MQSAYYIIWIDQIHKFGGIEFFLQSTDINWEDFYIG